MLFGAWDFKFKECRENSSNILLPAQGIKYKLVTLNVSRIWNGMNVFFLLCHIKPVLGLHHVAAGGDPHPGPLSHKVPGA